MNKSTGLIEKFSCEGDAEFRRQNGDASLSIGVLLIEFFDALLSLNEVAGLNEFIEQARNMPPFQGLTEMGDFPFLVHIQATNSEWVHLQMSGHMLDHRLAA